MRKTGKSFRTRLRQLKLMNCPAIATAAIIGTVPSPNKAMNAAPCAALPDVTAPATAM